MDKKVSRGLSCRDKDRPSKIAVDMESHPTPRATPDARSKIVGRPCTTTFEVKCAFRVLTRVCGVFLVCSLSRFDKVGVGR